MRGFPLRSAFTALTWSSRAKSGSLAGSRAARVSAASTGLHIPADVGMAAAKCPEPAWHTATVRSPIPKALKRAEHVFVLHGARRIPLSRPYDGPFRVIKKEEKFFVVKMGSREQTVLVDRLKPAFGFADPPPVVPVPKEARATVQKTMPKTKRALNPAAEVFVPAEVRTRAGRTTRQPERLGF